ncbi:MAG: hypothetical protein ACTSQ7_16235 [Alphaproteobacteria bacterium]
MNEEDGNGRDGAGLWARARPGWRVANAPGSGESEPNRLALAAYLDDTLDETGRAAVEAWLAASPEALELMIAARGGLAEPPGPAPESLISRAQGLVRAPARESAGLGVWLRGLIGFEPEAWRPLAWAGVTAALLLVVSVGGFELGRLGADRLVSIQSATLGDDLELGLDDPADEFI